jgi:hypothetical protein
MQPATGTTQVKPFRHLAAALFHRLALLRDWARQLG